MRAHAYMAVTTLVLAAVTTTAPAARAQGTPPASHDAPAGDSKLEEARQRYQRGLQLFNEQNYDAARVEFERAYQLAPSYKILYNIGLAYEQLGDYVGALSTLQRYLELGGTEIGEERRAEVSKELAQIRPRIARLTITVNVPGAEFLVDDACATDAKSGVAVCGPSGEEHREILINPGRRRIMVRKAGYLPESQTVTVAGSDRAELSITLRELAKQYVEKKSNPFVLPMAVGWSVTAAGLITTGILGGLALGAKSDTEAKTEQFGSTESDRSSELDKAKTLGTGTVVGMVVTGAAVVVSTYFTIRAVRWKGESAEANIQVGANGVALSGRF